MVGMPLFMDGATATGERISYARVFIEIKANKELPNKIRLQLEEGDEMDVDIAYEWISPICKNRKTFGHVEHLCLQRRFGFLRLRIQKIKLLILIIRETLFLKGMEF